MVGFLLPGVIGFLFFQDEDEEGAVATDCTADVMEAVETEGDGEGAGGK